MKYFEMVKVCNRLGLLIDLRLNDFNPGDFPSMDAPETIPSGSMLSWDSAAHPIVQGSFEREQNV